ncbi:MAG: hypothetical protein HY779_02505 [Rubrobacteridae bacterium]|nr:hypothetical protein [Rubrobacteridae bacterium]
MTVSRIELPDIQTLKRQSFSESRWNDFIEVMTALLIGIVIYISLRNSTALFPEFLSFTLIGILIGWILKGKVILAMLSSVFCTPLSIFLFGFPSYSTPFNDTTLSIIWGLLLVFMTVFIASASSFLIPKLKNESVFAWVLIAIIAINSLFTIYVANQPSVNPRAHLQWDEPPNEHYEFDGSIYLKTFYLMNQGMGYYEAMGQAYVLDARFDQKPGQILAYRFPTIFYLWHTFLPGEGIFILYAFVLLALISLACSDLIAVKFIAPPAAFLSPVLLSAYLVSGATRTWFLFAELWASLIALIALTVLLTPCKSRSHNVYACVVSTSLILTASIIREQLVMIPFIIAISGLITKYKKNLAVWLVPIAGFITAFIVHYIIVKPLMDKSSINPSIWINLMPDFGYLLEIITFNCDLYELSSIIGVIAVIAAVIGSLKIENSRLRIMLAGIIVLPVVVFTFVRSGEYWGALLMPFAFSLAPLALQYLPGFRIIPDKTD